MESTVTGEELKMRLPLKFDQGGKTCTVVTV